MKNKVSNFINKIRILYSRCYLFLKGVQFGKNPFFLKGQPMIKNLGKIIIGDDFKY